MCEVLFRGKSAIDGEWLEGDLYHRNKEVLICSYYSGFTIAVIPETVGQYIGLIDKNGRKVFEGDILKSHWDEDDPEDFCYEVVLWYDNGWCIKQGTTMPDRLDLLECSEVVGNVWDNP